MYEPGFIHFTEFVAHFKNDAAPVALVSAAPDQDTGMILIPFNHAVHPIQHQRKVIHPVPRQSLLPGQGPCRDHVPYTMGLHIAFIDHIESQLVAQLVKHAGIGIMTGPNSVQIIAFHRDQIPADFLRRHGPSRLRAVIMPVHTLEDNPTAVDQHQPVFQFKPAETDLLIHRFPNPAFRICDLDIQIVQVRKLRAPLFGVLYGNRGGSLTVTDVKGALSQHGFILPQLKDRPAAAGGLCLHFDLKDSVPVAVIQKRANL